MTLADLTRAIETIGIRLRVRLVVDAPAGNLTPELRAALADHKPLILARLVSTELDHDDWPSFRAEVDDLESGGLTRADAIRHAYARRFKIDPGPIDPEPLGWLWTTIGNGIPEKENSSDPAHQGDPS